uniref:Uncharacterized protein n=1 Tax=Chromera velia CCMP2878 TaxID=1169474 RepID=A0A0G4HL00_9ALVE|eukprot:Cvel_28776.t1-p1 / transcript=Cvel_28776.t1 / gene=Cvel_28776 / organism=Chromera_velia_CCMP2878 / gene_product=hypothetical protein / transcript_product=hypothetical protein / location=Cvel_scaffold3830:9993-11862(-) / protein_length=107 / sequence_SO=supercontig / SO=protein_coding / is_pseudo=false
MPSSAFAKYFLFLLHDQRTAYSSFLPALPLHSSGPPNARACRFQSLPFQADAKAAEEDDAVRCESPRGGAGGQAEGGYEWRKEEEEEEEDEEEEDEEEEAWREEEEE